jgi:hypothetical protein
LTVRKEYPVPERRDRVGECDAMIQHHPELRFRVVEVAVEPNVEEVGGGGGVGSLAGGGAVGVEEEGDDEDTRLKKGYAIDR